MGFTRRRILAAILILLVAGAIQIGIHLRPAPVVSAQPVEGRVHRTLQYPVVDARHHLVYGVSPHAVRVLDEMTGHARHLVQFSTQHRMMFLQFDPGSNHLVVSDLRIDAVSESGGPSPATSLVYLVDAGTGRILTTLTIGHLALRTYIGHEGVVALDPSLHHAVVLDQAGNGFLLDTRSGVVLQRLHTGTPASFYSQENMAVTDPRTHRIFVGLFGPDSESGRAAQAQAEVAVIDSRNGSVQTVQGTGVPVQSMALDARRDRVFVLSPNALTELDSASAGVLHRIPIGVLGNSVGVDDRTGRAFVASGGASYTSKHGTLRMVNSSSGRVLQSISFGGVSEAGGGVAFGKTHMAVDRAANHLFIVDDMRATLDVFDARTGRHLRTILLVSDAHGGIALDEKLHRLLISGVRGTTVLDSRSPSLNTTS